MAEADDERRAVLVGRASEMLALDEALRAVREKGTTRIVSIIGASGIGKSRLVREFLTKVAQQNPAARVYRGEARAGGPSYDIFTSVLRGRFGLVEGMNAEAASLHVRGQVAEVLEDRKVGDVLYFLG